MQEGVNDCVMSKCPRDCDGRLLSAVDLVSAGLDVLHNIPYSDQSDCNICGI